MQYKCEKCLDTGSIKGELYLDCASCDVAKERADLHAYLTKNQFMHPHELAWLVHQRALAMAPKQEATSLDMVPRQLVKEAIADLYTRMQKSYAAEPTLRITYMDLVAVHAHIKRLGIGGCLDGAEEILTGMNAAAPAVANGALPELPDPDVTTIGHREFWNKEQMRAYGQACAAAKEANGALTDEKIMEIVWQFQAGGDDGKFTFLSADLPHMFRAILTAAGPDAALVRALDDLLEMYLQGANSGDWGYWNPEEETEVIAARAALYGAKGN